MSIRGWSGVLAVVLATTLAGCGGGDDGGGAASKQDGWPRATDGRITADMCGLLTADDWTKAGAGVAVDPTGTPGSTNSVDCSYGVDTMTLELQPSIEGAKAGYDLDLGTHRTVVETVGGSELAEGLVAGADASWADKGTTDAADWDLYARRGALLVRIGLSPAGTDDPKPKMAELAAAVLERAGDLGKTADGGVRILKFAVEVDGAGTVDVQYVLGGLSVTEKGVKSPYALELPIPERAEIPFSIGATAPSDAMTAKVSCAAAIATEVLDEQSGPYTVTCQGTIQPNS